MLKKLIENISLKASITLDYNEIGLYSQNGENIQDGKSIERSIRCNNSDVLKECLCQVEDYFLNHVSVNEISEELKKIEYKSFRNGSTTIHAISLDSYNSCPLLQLLNIRQLLIGALDFYNKSFRLQVETGSWYWLLRDCSINLPRFLGTKAEDVATVEKDIASELNQRLALDHTNYFAFRISNGLFSEPYILKISNGKIQEVICSTSGHTSTNLHNYLWKFIKSNNSSCQIYRTIPLKHDGDCTRYSDYALIQFKYLSEMHGADKAFSLLNKNKPYEVNQETLRDFQMLSQFFGYDPIQKIIYPLLENVRDQIATVSLPEHSPGDVPAQCIEASLLDKEKHLKPKDNTMQISQSLPENAQVSASPAPLTSSLPDKEHFIAEKKESNLQRSQQIHQFMMWIKKLEVQRDDLLKKYSKSQKDNQHNAYGAICQLIVILDTYGKRYANKEFTLQEFKEYSFREIQTKRCGVLSEHRGVKEILANLLLAIGTLGMGYALAAICTLRFNPIKCNTRSINLLDEGNKHLNTLVF